MRPLSRKLFQLLSHLVILSVFLISCSREDAPPPFEPPQQEARTGDVLFRRGRSLISRAVLWADSAGEYSHVGVIIRHKGDVLVVHAEPGDRLEDGHVRAEPVDSFLASDRASTWALYRPVKQLDSAEASVLTDAALQHVRNRTPFDAALDTGDSTQMYCTELVLDLYRAASRDLDIPTRRLSLLGQTREVILPSDIASSRSFRFLTGSPRRDTRPGNDVNF